MSGTHQHTWQPYHVGHLLVTVQLDSAAAESKIERHQDLAIVTRRLISLANSLHLPVTWAVSDPAYSAATSLILQSEIEHELAILGDANWVGVTAGRTRFARELVRRLTQARATGLNVTSLVPHVAHIENHIDLVVKQHVTAIAGLEPNDSAHRPTSPRAMHYGVWELPVSESMPLPYSRFFDGRRRLWKRIRHTARDAGTFHLMICAPAIAQRGESAAKSVDWIIRQIAQLRDRGIVQVETMRAVSARLSNVPSARPQQSILRAVA